MIDACFLLGLNVYLRLLLEELMGEGLLHDPSSFVDDLGDVSRALV